MVLMDMGSLLIYLFRYFPTQASCQSGHGDGIKMLFAHDSVYESLSVCLSAEHICLQL